MKVKQLFLISFCSQCFSAARLLPLLVVAIIVWPQNVAGQQAGIPKLTLSQVEVLVSHHVPDSTMQTEIKRRGLAFAPNSAVVESLRAKGAGPLTLAAIETFIPKVSLHAETHRDLPALQTSATEPGVGSVGSKLLIASITPVLPQANQTIIIAGNGFGNQAAYDGNSPYIQIADLTRNWNAGNSGSNDQVTLRVALWTNTQIRIEGFTGAYGGGWSLGPGDQVRIQVWNPQTGAGPASSTVAVAAQSVQEGALQTSATEPGVGSVGSKLLIASITPVLPQANQTIIIAGNGFGNQAAYDGNSPYIQIADLTRNWNAGNSGSNDQVTLRVALWTNTQIRIEGFTGAYGGGWSLGPGDQVRIQVWNPQTGAGPASSTVAVAAQSVQEGGQRGLPATPKAATPQHVTISSGVAQGLLIHQVQPAYPPLARQARIQGTVQLHALIGKDGTIKNLQVASGHPMLTSAALTAVQGWRYKPYYLNGEPVEVKTTINVSFALNDGP